MWRARILSGTDELSRRAINLISFQASAFPEIYAYAVAGCTYEGENIVMLLQVARFIHYADNIVFKSNFKIPNESC